MTGKRIKAEDHAQFEVLHEEGYSICQIATRLKLARTSVARSINNFKSTGRYGYEKPKGRTKTTTKRMDDAIILSAKKSPRKTSKTIDAALPQDTVTASALPSQRTIRTGLLRANLKSYKPAKKTKLFSKNTADRLALRNKYQAWTPEQWKWVMFSDESQIFQFYAFCRHIRRPHNKRYSPRYIIPTVECCKSYGRGAICANERCGLWFMLEGTFINGTVYLKELKKKLTNFMKLYHCSQHDGALSHRTKAVGKWVADNLIQILGQGLGQQIH